MTTHLYKTERKLDTAKKKRNEETAKLRESIDYLYWLRQSAYPDLVRLAARIPNTDIEKDFKVEGVADVLQ